MNNRLAALLDQRAEISGQINALLDSVHEENREINDDESAELATLEASLDKTVKQIELQERIALKIGSNGGTNPERTRANGSQNIGQQNTFATFSEQLMAIAKHGMGHGTDRRLIQAAGTGLNEQSPADGGFLLQPEYANDLMKYAFETGVLASKVRRRPIGANANQLKYNYVVNTSRATGSRYGGMQMYWLEEGGLKTASKPQFQQGVLTLKKLIGLCYATDELLEDAVALEAILRDAFAEEAGFMLDDAIYNGPGGGQPLGLINAPAKVTVSKTASQTAATVSLANVLAMYARFTSAGKNGGNGSKPYWLMNAEVMAQLFTMTLGGTSTVYGAPVFLPSDGASGRPRATLLGIPILEIEQAAALGTEGDIMLTDLNQYLMIEKGTTKYNSSIHVRFIYDETTFRWVLRVDGKPLWPSAVTPYKGSNSISPVVTLETRA